MDRESRSMLGEGPDQLSRQGGAPMRKCWEENDGYRDGPRDRTSDNTSRGYDEDRNPGGRERRRGSNAHRLEPEEGYARNLPSNGGGTNESSRQRGGDGGHWEWRPEEKAEMHRDLRREELPGGHRHGYSGSTGFPGEGRSNGLGVGPVGKGFTRASTMHNPVDLEELASIKAKKDAYRRDLEEQVQ